MISKQSVVLVLICILTFLAVPNLVTAEEPKNDTSKFAGINFGVGLSFTMDTGKHDRVEQASVVNGIVRIDKQNNDVPRILLESHYFFLPKTSFLGVPKENWGLGPFVAIQPGSDNIIQAISLGLMVGFKKKFNDSSWNLGVGAIVDPHVKILGDGIKKDQPLPTGETQVRLKETSQWGVVFLASFGF